MKQQYDSYKPSGIDWIGDIPSHWESKRLRYVCEFRNGYTPSKANDDYWSDGTIPWYRMEDIRESGRFLKEAKQYVSPEAVKGCGLFEAGSFILATTATIGEHAMLIVDSLANQQFTNLKIRKSLSHRVIKEFFFYYLFVIDEFCKSTTKTTTFPAMDMTDLKNFGVSIPPLAEQEAIAAWLDEKCGEIDAAIAKVDREIELIDELKQSEISRVVTRGLNPDATLRPSGIDWIGEIPSHWKAMPLKRQGTMNTGLTFTKADLVECGDAVVSYGQIHSSKNDKVNLTEDLVRYIPKSISNVSALVPQGSFIFADTSEDLEGCGNAAYNNSDRVLYAGYHTIILRRKNIGGKYLAYLFQTDTWRSQIRSRVSGVKVYSVTQAILATTSIILPPLAEQEAIAAWLDKKCAEIDELKAKLTKKRETLAELRQSIISEVVTGKRKVI